MGTKYKILIMGASYGSLLGTKLALAGHSTHLICLPAEADLINKEGAIVRMPVKGRDALVEINSKKLPGKMTAGGTAGVKPPDYDLVALAMQEPQYRSPGVRELLAAVAKAKVPCMSIMNMPPLPYLLHRRERLGRLRPEADDALQPRPAGFPSAGRKGERAAGEAADQLQVGVLRFEHPYRDPAPARVGYRSVALRHRLRQDRAAGQAQGARLGLRASRQMGDAPRRKLPLRAEGRRAAHQGRRAQRPRSLARCIQLGGQAVRLPGRGREGHGALRKIRQCGVIAPDPVLRGARARQRRSQHRAHRPPGADHRRAERHALR